MERIFFALHSILLCITLQLNLSLELSDMALCGLGIFQVSREDVLTVFTYETNIRVILIQYVL